MTAAKSKKLNAPNDVVVAAEGAIWFTDPGYGIFGNYEGHLAEPELLPRVYRLDGEDRPGNRGSRRFRQAQRACLLAGRGEALYHLTHGGRSNML
jgi:sugar lactone lactonase YvrE